MIEKTQTDSVETFEEACTESLLEDRGVQYGSFERNASNAQAIKEILRFGTTWEQLEDDQKEALDLIATKLSRIIGGDEDYVDNWTDIIGYARLVERRMLADEYCSQSVSS